MHIQYLCIKHGESVPDFIQEHVAQGIEDYGKGQGAEAYGKSADKESNQVQLELGRHVSIVCSL